MAFETVRIFGCVGRGAARQEAEEDEEKESRVAARDLPSELDTTALLVAHDT